MSPTALLVLNILTYTFSGIAIVFSALTFMYLRRARIARERLIELINNRENNK